MENNDEPGRNSKPVKISTGHRSIDTAIQGGFLYGTLYCITSEPDRGAKEIVQNLLMTHLLSSSDSSATLIDTTLTFDVRKIYHMLLTSKTEHGSVSQSEAMQVLERLQMMQVFDFVGMNESIGELRENLETGGTRPKGTISDSEGEDEVRESQSPVKKNSAPRPLSGDTSKPAAAQILIIDSVSHVAMPLVQTNYPEGQALVSSFMRSLAQLTRTWKLCTIVLCNSSTKRFVGEDMLSQFGSCHIRPALGMTFAYLVDMLLYVHSLPEAPSNKTPVKEGESSEDGEMVSVLEIVQDRYGGRLGRWAPFTWDSNGSLIEVT